MFIQFNFWLSLLLVIVYTEDLYSKFNQHDYNLKFTRLELGNCNKRFFKHCNVVTFKYNRSVAVANMTFIPKLFLGRKHSLVLAQVYKFYSNEYRTFPIRIQLNFSNCMINNLIGARSAFTDCGNFSNDNFNFKKGKTYHACNLTPDQSRFPPMIPNGQFKLELSLIINNSKSFTINGYGKYRPIKYN